MYEASTEGTAVSTSLADQSTAHSLPHDGCNALICRDPSRGQRPFVPRKSDLVWEVPVLSPSGSPTAADASGQRPYGR